MGHDDEYLFPQSYHNERDRSHTPPMFYSPSYPPPPEETMLLPPYGTVQGYRAPEYPQYHMSHHNEVPITLPSMTHFNDAIKREPSGSYEDNMPSYMYNSYLNPVDMSGSNHSPYEQMPHVSSSRSPVLPHPQLHPLHRPRDHR